MRPAGRAGLRRSSPLAWVPSFGSQCRLRPLYRPGLLYLAISKFSMSGKIFVPSKTFFPYITGFQAPLVPLKTFSRYKIPFLRTDREKVIGNKKQNSPGIVDCSVNM